MTPDVQQLTEAQHHFTSGEWSLLITVLLTGLTTMTVTIINTIKASTAGRKMDDTKAHLEKQDEKIETIHSRTETINTQTNGNLAAVQAQLEVSRREVAELKAAAAAKAEAALELAAERQRHQPVLIADRRVRRSTKARK